jgi:hypothetical protein
MHPSDLENAYAYEIERRKDEMRDAANYRFERQHRKERKHVAIPIMLLGFLIWFLVALMSH